jgi:hypothetical protein
VRVPSDGELAHHGRPGATGHLPRPRAVALAQDAERRVGRRPRSRQQAVGAIMVVSTVIEPAVPDAAGRAIRRRSWILRRRRSVRAPGAVREPPVAVAEPQGRRGRPVDPAPSPSIPCARGGQHMPGRGYKRPQTWRSVRWQAPPPVMMRRPVDEMRMGKTTLAGKVTVATSANGQRRIGDLNGC